MDQRVTKIINYLVDEFTKLEEIEAVAIAGSISANRTDSLSDIDIYFFTKNDISLDFRKSVINPLASCSEIGNDAFGAGDEFISKETNVAFDLMYFSMDWITENINNVIVNNSSCVGYTTCFWNTIRRANIIYDRKGELKLLKDKCEVPYPETLKKNIITTNYPLLLKNISSFGAQIKKAVKRNDTVSINHRISAFLGSYFDIIFAVNEMTHPGEKRLVSIVLNECTKIPNNFERDVNKLLTESFNGLEAVSANIESLVKNLHELLFNEALL